MARVGPLASRFQGVYFRPMSPLPPSLYLGFMHNHITGEHFIAAAHGANPPEAMADLRQTYPSAAYHVLTLYPARAVAQYLSDAQRWPGLPSRVQPSLTDLLATQRIRTQVGGLPPLQRSASAAAAPAGLNAAQIEQVKTIALGMPAETRALAARLLAGGVPQAAPQVVKQASPLPNPVAQPAAQPVVKSSLPPMPSRAAVPNPLPTLPAMAPLQARIDVSPTVAPRGGNLKDALTAMRAISSHAAPAAAQATTNLAARSASSQPITRMPQAFAAAASSSALPASARGLAAPAALPPAPSPFAVGKVSAISVLKALRAGR